LPPQAERLECAQGRTEKNYPRMRFAHCWSRLDLNFSPVISPVRVPAYEYFGVLRCSPTLPKWWEVRNHAALTR
jgi:hypothetical protein